jgi:hypothetical protein
MLQISLLLVPAFCSCFCFFFVSRLGCDGLGCGWELGSETSIVSQLASPSRKRRLVRALTTKYARSDSFIAWCLWGQSWVRCRLTLKVHDFSNSRKVLYSYTAYAATPSIHGQNIKFAGLGIFWISTCRTRGFWHGDMIRVLRKRLSSQVRAVSLGMPRTSLRIWWTSAGVRVRKRGRLYSWAILWVDLLSSRYVPDAVPYMVESTHSPNHHDPVTCMPPWCRDTISLTQVRRPWSERIPCSSTAKILDAERYTNTLVVLCFLQHLTEAVIARHKLDW